MRSIIDFIPKNVKKKTNLDTFSFQTSPSSLSTSPPSDFAAW